MNTTPLAVIILAAGKGTRMKSSMAKVLHDVFYQPMAGHVIQSAATLSPQQIISVIGHQQELVQKALAPFGCQFAIQQKQCGTGHAVLAAEASIKEEIETVLILCGDTPLILPETLQTLYNTHVENENDITLVTTTLTDPFGYGRILCDEGGGIQAIVEEKDASDGQRQINQVNAGIYCVKKKVLFEALKNVGTDNKQGEMYLTDIVAIGVGENKRVRPFNVNNPIEVLGVNSRAELSSAEKEMQMRRNKHLMASGVTLISPETIRVSPFSSVSSDCILEPCTQIFGASSVESGCRIEQGAILKNCTLGKNTIIGAGSYLANTSLPEGSTIPPHTYQI